MSNSRRRNRDGPGFGSDGGRCFVSSDDRSQSKPEGTEPDALRHQRMVGISNHPTMANCADPANIAIAMASIDPKAPTRRAAATSLAAFMQLSLEEAIRRVGPGRRSPVRPSDARSRHLAKPYPSSGVSA